MAVISIGIIRCDYIEFNLSQYFFQLFYHFYVRRCSQIWCEILYISIIILTFSQSKIDTSMPGRGENNCPSSGVIKIGEI